MIHSPDTRLTPAAARARGLTLITAHSGCEGTAPNSLDHLNAAFSSGAELLEVDVRRDASGRLYLSHDLPSDPAACVDFSCLLDGLAQNPGMRVNCDVKTPGLIAPVMDAASARGLSDRILFTGICNDVPEEIASRGGELWYSLWPSADNEGSIRAAVETCRRIGCPVVNLHYPMITEENYALLRGNGLDYSAWTVDDEASLRRLLSMGILNITTRRPSLALALRDELQGRGKGAARD